jgi:hypothetical protein
MQQDSNPQRYRPREQATSANNGTFTTVQAATLIQRHLATRTPKKFDGRCPYVGPISFAEADARLYFGRENLIDDLLNQVERGRFIAVVGPENAGKTSLLNAGLIFGLRNGALMDSDNWLIHRFTPTDDPLRALADACAALGERAGLTSVMTDAIRKRGLTGPNALNELVDMLFGTDRHRRAVLIIDQFEEVFTKAKSAHETKSFINFITQAVQHANTRATVVIGLRSEFLPNVDAHPELKSLIERHTLRLAPMEDAELARAIVLPALETGAQIEPQLVARLVADVGGDPTQLPKLQMALRDLFLALPAKPGVDKVLTLADYIDFGPLVARLDDRPPAPATSSPQGKGAAQPQVVPLREALGEARAVSHFAEQEARMRKMRTFTILAGIGAAVMLALGAYGAYSGVQANQRAQAAATSEAIALAEATRAVQSASQSDAARATAEAQSTQAAQERAVAVATNSVAEAIATQSVGEAQLAAEVKQTAEALATTVADRGQNIVAMEATVSAVATTSGAAVRDAFATREVAEATLKQTRSRELAARAVTLIGTDPQVALLVALEAERTQHTQQSEDAIRRTFVAAFPDEGVFRVGSPVNDARFSPDGTLLVTASRDGRVKLWDIATRQVLTSIIAHVGPVNAVAFSADGTRLVTGGADRTVRILDALAGRSVSVLSGHTGSVNSVDFSPDGSLAVSGSADKTARVWDVAAGKAITAPLQFSAAISTVQFSEDGQVSIILADGTTAAVEPRTSKLLYTGQGVGFPVVMQSNNDLIVQPDGGGGAVVLTGHSGPATIAQDAPDRILTVSADGTARSHTFRLDTLSARAQELLGRDLTCDERVRYLGEAQDCAAAPPATPTK